MTGELLVTANNLFLPYWIAVSERLFPAHGNFLSSDDVDARTESGQLTLCDSASHYPTAEVVGSDGRGCRCCQSHYSVRLRTIE